VASRVWLPAQIPGAGTNLISQPTRSKKCQDGALTECSKQRRKFDKLSPNSL